MIKTSRQFAAMGIILLALAVAMVALEVAGITPKPGHTHIPLAINCLFFSGCMFYIARWPRRLFDRS